MGHDMSILLLVMIMLTVFTHGRKQHDNLLAQIDAVMKKNCNVPQPRLITHEELQLTDPNVIYHPLVTVLHRCNNSTGWCSSKETCHAVEEQSVTLVFKQFNMSSGKSSLILRNETNHTKCDCLDMSLMLTKVITLPDVKEETLDESLQKHIEMVEYFINQPPQPHLIPLLELNLTNSGAIYSPIAGMLNECIYDIQFCSLYENNSYCKCIEIEEIDLYFIAQYNSTNSQLTVRTKQHKSCSCASQDKTTEPTTTGSNKCQDKQYNIYLTLSGFMFSLFFHKDTFS